MNPMQLTSKQTPHTFLIVAILYSWRQTSSLRAQLNFAIYPRIDKFSGFTVPFLMYSNMVYFFNVVLILSLSVTVKDQQKLT